MFLPGLRQALARGRQFGSATDGQIAMLFGLMATVLVTAAGGGLDLMRAYNTRQKLSEVATLACQYASRPSIVKLARSDAVIPAGGKSYVDMVNAYIDAAIVSQKVAWAPTRTFTPVPNGPADVTLSVDVPTSFARVIQIEQIPVSATAHCYDSPATTPDPVYVAKEGFEARGTPTTTWYNDWATYGIDGKSSSTPTSNASKTPIYTGADNTAWYGTGYCLETDQVGVISSTAPEGRQTAELDCENGSGSAGNSAISTRVQLYAGNYELRYNYRSRVGYPNYDPAYLCGSAASDLSWANDTNAVGGPVSNALRTNQINVYLDRTSDKTFAAAPSHTTIDGTQQLAGSNLIDMCVYSSKWIERSVRITVTTPSYYWLSFAADGQNDSYGGQIDNIRLCIGTCPGALQDNFPASWQAVNNGGSNKLLFRDTFDTPTYTQDPYISFNRTKGGNLANSTGTSGSSQSGWPSQAAGGWATGPYNQVNVWLQDAYQGRQYVSMQGWNGYSAGTDSLNRVISRKFLLDPGYYNVSYAYISMVDFSASAGIYGTFCTTAPGSGYVYPTNTTLAGRPRYTSSNVSLLQTTNILGVFMSHGQLVSTLNANTAMGNASNGNSSSSTIGGQATYTNPDGTVTTTPTVPPDKVNWSAYDATAVNPVIDTCGYASGYAWVPRSANLKITKPGWYWLTFSAQGDDVYGTGNGPAIDDVKLTALGSPYMTSPPGNATTIPAPGPQPDSRLYFGGDFYIIADPFTPTAPLQ